VVNSGQFGATLVNESTTDTTLSAFLGSLHATKGDTYVGVNATPGDQFTFIVTDTASGQIGGVELAGDAFGHSSFVLANHTLTLHLA
jgi:hypothetical protein